jgi:hypothetical protein
VVGIDAEDQFGWRAFLSWGLCPQAPGIYRFFSRQNGRLLFANLRAASAAAPLRGNEPGIESYGPYPLDWETVEVAVIPE